LQQFNQGYSKIQDKENQFELNNNNSTNSKEKDAFLSNFNGNIYRFKIP
jgi:hypothetical protein